MKHMLLLITIMIIISCKGKQSENQHEPSVYYADSLFFSKDSAPGFKGTVGGPATYTLRDGIVDIDCLAIPGSKIYPMASGIHSINIAQGVYSEIPLYNVNDTALGFAGYLPNNSGSRNTHIGTMRRDTVPENLFIGRMEESNIGVVIDMPIGDNHLMSIGPKDTIQIKHLNYYSRKVKYINCSVANCPNHDIVEDFPDDAGNIFYDMGWRFTNDQVLCPDHARDWQRGNKKSGSGKRSRQ